MDYNIIYSKRKTISLIIKNGKLEVRAPIGAKPDKIHKMVAEHEKWILKGIEKTKNSPENQKIITQDEEKLLRARAKILLKEKTDYYAEIMGVKYGRITITGAKTRFGSCSSEKNISYSFRLMLYPEAAIDYVVVHELAHIREMNHSPRFWAIVASVFSDYKVRKKLLRH